MRKHLRFLFRFILPLIVLISVLGVSACTQASPYPEDMWTQNVYPGTTNIYNIGSAVYTYHEGHFTELFLNGHLFTSGVVSSTWVVAASDSRDVYRADLVCDGVDDDVQIQTVLNSLPANGGRVILLEGTYNTTSNIQILSNTILEGQGVATLILANSPTITQVFDVVGNNVTIKNLKIEIVAGCGIVGARPNAIYNNNQPYLTVDSVRIVGDSSVAQEILLQQNGICCIDVDDITVSNCVINNFMRNGIYSTVIFETSICNNYVNNTLYNNSDSGLYISYNSQSIASGNHCLNNVLRGILVYQASHNELIGNSCALNDHYGIDLYNNATNNVVSGNDCSDNSWTGIRVSGASTHNTIVGNVCNSNDDTARDGIEIDEGSDYTTISGNTCSYNGAQGIHVPLCSYSSVSGNVCDHNAGDGIKVEGTAIGNADYNVVDANVCYNNGGNGVEIEGDFSGGNNYANKNIVTSNQLSGNTGASLNDDGTNTQTDNNII